MPKHITVSHNIHEMTTHQITEGSWSGTLTIELYDVTVYTGARFVAQINDATSYERIIIEVGHNNTSTGFDETRILLDGQLMDLTFATRINAGNFELDISNGDGAASNTIKYYIMPSDL